VVLTAAANPLSELPWFNVVLLALVLGLSLRVLVPVLVRSLRERKSRRSEDDGDLLGANRR
jgi:hypothetical protein